MGEHPTATLSGSNSLKERQVIQATYRTLKHAPIVEAVVDVRVPMLNVDSELLSRWRSAFGESFPDVQEQRSIEGLVQVIEGTLSQSLSDSGVRGLLFRSDDRHEAIQVTDLGFSFSKLRPYTTWPDVLSSAQRWWGLFMEATRPGRPSRLALRYINQFRIPDVGAGPTYLQAPPVTPPEFGPNELQGALTRLILVDVSNSVTTRFVQAIEVSDAETRVLIDIDSFDTGEFDPEEPDFWERFEVLRAVKNRIFFGAITEHAAEEFDR